MAWFQRESENNNRKFVEKADEGTEDLVVFTSDELFQPDEPFAFSEIQEANHELFKDFRGDLRESLDNQDEKRASSRRHHSSEKFEEISFATETKARNMARSICSTFLESRCSPPNIILHEMKLSIYSLLEFEYIQKKFNISLLWTITGRRSTK